MSGHFRLAFRKAEANHGMHSVVTLICLAEHFCFTMDDTVLNGFTIGITVLNGFKIGINVLNYKQKNIAVLNGFTIDTTVLNGFTW